MQLTCTSAMKFVHASIKILHIYNTSRNTADGSISMPVGSHVEVFGKMCKGT